MIAQIQRSDVAGSVCRLCLSCRWEYFDQVSPGSIPAMYHNQPVGRTAPGALRCILPYAVVAYSMHSNAYSVHCAAYSPMLWLHTQCTVMHTRCTALHPSMHSNAYSMHSNAYSMHSNAYSMHSNAYSMHSTAYLVHCSTLQCTLGCSNLWSNAYSRCTPVCLYELLCCVRGMQLHPNVLHCFQCILESTHYIV